MSWLMIIPFYLVAASAIATALGRMLRSEATTLKTGAAEAKPGLATTERFFAGVSYAGSLELSKPLLKAS